MALSPLFGIYDPSGDMRRQIGLGIPETDEEILGIVPLGQRRPQIEDLLPEDEKETLLRQLANQGASGLSGFGWLLDTPGAVVRGLLSGGPMKGLSAIWEDSEQRVTGRELARQYGLAGKEDSWANFGGGLLAEIALDPLSYVGIGLLGRGAKTAAGEAAKRAGLLTGDLGLLAKKAGYDGTAEFLRHETPETLIKLAGDDAAQQAARGSWEMYAGANRDELLTKPLTRMNRVSAPGFSPGAVDLFGETVGDAVTKFSDTAISKALDAPYLGPALRTANALVGDSRVMGFTDEKGQWFGRKLSEAQRQADLAAGRDINDYAVDAFFDIGPKEFRSDEFAQRVRNWFENQADQSAAGPMPAGFDAAFTGMTSKIQAQLRDRLAAAQELGIPLDEFRQINNVGYFPRQVAEIDNPRYAPNYQPKQSRPRVGAAIAQVGEGGQASRRDYTGAFPAWVLDKMAKDETLQSTLRNLANATGSDGFTPVKEAIDTWLKTNASDFLRPDAAGWAPGPFDYLLGKADPFTQPELFAKRQARVDQAYADLADSLRRTPLQNAEQRIPKFGNALNDLAGYIRKERRRQATAGVLLDELADPANIITKAAGDVPGGSVYTPAEALGTFGFVAKAEGDEVPAGLAALAKRMGIPPEKLGDVSYDKAFIDGLNARISRARSPRELEGLQKIGKWYTDTFKTLALASPARSVRDAYSGAFAAATEGGFNPLDWVTGVRTAGGDYSSLPGRLRGTPGFTEDMTDDEILRKFLKQAGFGLTSGTVADDIGREASNVTLRETFPGGAGGLFEGVTKKNYRDYRTYSPLSVRGSQRNPNPALDFFDRLASSTDAGNRLGTYITRLRKGDSPAQAKAISDLTQVVYSADNFTPFERDYMTAIFPFYRYSKGITPLIAKELTEKPAGLMGQSIRAINRAGEPSEDRFVPEYLRQSAAIPLDDSIPLVSDILGVDTPGVTRFLTNIDLPHESVLNLFTPGLGNSLVSRVGDSLMKTGSNILGQTNPLLKGPLESVMNRQFYSGRQLSDLYSILEQKLGPVGRGLEQLAVNAPGGSRLLGAYRQATDQRISGPERAAKLLFNTLTGMKVQDVDQDKTIRLAARTTLNQLLDQAPGMSTYENLFIKPEALEQLSDEEKRQYLLYRVLQAEAARKARDKKKAADDPLSILGVEYR